MSNKPTDSVQEKQVSIENSKNTNNNQSSNQNQEQIDFTNFLQHAHNPVIVFFTLVFKVLAIIFYFI